MFYYLIGHFQVNARVFWVVAWVFLGVAQSLLLATLADLIIYI